MTIYKILTLIKQLFLPDHLTNQFQNVKFENCLTPYKKVAIKSSCQVNE